MIFCLVSWGNIASLYICLLELLLWHPIALGSGVFFALSLLVQFSCVHLFSTPWTAARQASLSFTISWSLLKLTSIESVMSSNYLILCHPLLLLPSILPSNRDFSNESAGCIRWPKYWGFSFSISPSNEYPGLISFRIDWLGLLAIQRTLRVFSSSTVKASILQPSLLSNFHIHTFNFTMIFTNNIIFNMFFYWQSQNLWDVRMTNALDIWEKTPDGNWENHTHFMTIPRKQKRHGFPSYNSICFSYRIGCFAFAFI